MSPCFAATLARPGRGLVDHPRFNSTTYLLLLLLLLLPRHSSPPPLRPPTWSSDLSAPGTPKHYRKDLHHQVLYIISATASFQPVSHDRVLHTPQPLRCDHYHHAFPRSRSDHAPRTDQTLRVLPKATSLLRSPVPRRDIVSFVCFAYRRGISEPNQAHLATTWKSRAAAYLFILSSSQPSSAATSLGQRALAA